MTLTPGLASIEVSVPSCALRLAMGFRTGKDEVLRSISVGWPDEREEL